MLNFKMYDDNGYLNMPAFIESNIPFVFIVGARGIGKTYGALQYYYDNKEKYMYMRRTERQLETVLDPELQPYKELNADRGINIQAIKTGKATYQFYQVNTNEDGEDVPEYDTCYGNAYALSTFANLRGFSGRDFRTIYWDEFIKQKDERQTLRDEGGAFFGAYETINRNRELAGQPPLQVIATANAFELANPIFMYLGIVDILDKELVTDKKEYVYLEDRGILVVHPLNSPISEKKKDTALYKALGKESTFTKLALENDFSYEERGTIVGKQNLREYRPIVRIGEITVYEHKSSDKIYITRRHTGTCPVFGNGDTECKRFFHRYRWLWAEYMYNTIVFEDYLCEILFKKYCSVK